MQCHILYNLTKTPKGSQFVQMSWDDTDKSEMHITFILGPNKLCLNVYYKPLNISMENMAMFLHML